MTFLVIYEETEEVVEYEAIPSASNFPTYTILYNVALGKWHRNHFHSIGMRQSWVPIEPEDEPDIPKSVRAMVLLMT